MSGRPPPAPLPIDEAAPALIAALRDRGAAVLIAPPGSGKTTRAPLTLLDAGLPAEGRTLLLQPRRVAARLAAKRMADERGTPVGGLIGWRVRFEDKTSRATRIEVITEGLLTRRLADDPLLDGVGMVILDEFHERSLHTDVGLALLAALRHELRPDLLLVVMSATMAPEPVQRFLGDAAGPAPLVRAEGRSFPVAIRHLIGPWTGTSTRRWPKRCGPSTPAAPPATPWSFCRGSPRLTAWRSSSRIGRLRGRRRCCPCTAG